MLDSTRREGEDDERERNERSIGELEGEGRSPHNDF